MKFFRKIKNIFVLGRKYNYPHVFDRILRRILLLAQVHKLVELTFRICKLEFNKSLDIDALRTKFLHENGKRVLQDLDAIFRKHKIVYWVDAGTLLGIMRDKAFVKDDMDMDIAVLCDDSEYVYQLLKENGYIVTCCFLYPYNSKVLLKIEKYRITIDIEFFQVEEKTGCLFYNEPMYPLSAHAKPERDNQWAILQHRFSSHVPGAVMRHVFDDIEVNIPKKWEQYLEVYYGKAWGTPLNRREYIEARMSGDKITNPYPRYRINDDVYVHYEKPSTLSVKLLPWKWKLQIFYNWLTKK